MRKHPVQLHLLHYLSIDSEKYLPTDISSIPPAWYALFIYKLHVGIKYLRE